MPGVLHCRLFRSFRYSDGVITFRLRFAVNSADLPHLRQRRNWRNLSGMPFLRQGSIHLGRVAGINLYLHWSWFVVAVIEIGSRQGRYSSLVWSALEYLALFAIVLLHEFGHALACRQVGGTVDRIMLWPLGGVAFVNPPQRPGATLWSLAAGPLVNVALLPVFGGAYLAAGALGWEVSSPDVYHLIEWILLIDVGLLVFNILPIYPLDGGQILRSLLWFFMGRARSLYIATILGFVGAAGLVCLALWMHSAWSLLIAAYMLLNCWSGFKSARNMMLLENFRAARGLPAPVAELTPRSARFGNARNAPGPSTHSNPGLFAPIAELSFPTPCAANARR